MPAKLSGYCKNRAVTVWSPQDFKENEETGRLLGTCLCNVTTALIRIKKLCAVDPSCQVFMIWNNKQLLKNNVLFAQLAVYVWAQKVINVTASCCRLPVN